MTSDTEDPIQQLQDGRRDSRPGGRKGERNLPAGVQPVSPPDAVAFYEFTRTLQAYKSITGGSTTLVLPTDSDLFRFLKGMDPVGVRGSAKASGDTRW